MEEKLNHNFILRVRLICRYGLFDPIEKGGVEKPSAGKR